MKYFNKLSVMIMIFSIVLLSLTLVSAESIIQAGEKTTKTFLSPFYRASMNQNTNYTYIVSLSPPDKVSGVSSAIISLQVYMTPTVTFNIWVNGQACNTPSYTISTTFASAGQAKVDFDCSNIITQAGTYIVTIRPTSANTGASTMWLEATYTNSPPGAMTIHGTEYTAGQSAKIWLQVMNSTGATIPNAVCYTDIYTPSNQEYVERATMVNFNHDGIYYYDLNTPDEQGVYPVIAICYYQAGQTFNFASSYTIVNGSYVSGTLSDMNVSDLSYFNTQETPVSAGDPRRYDFEFNFSYGKICNVSEVLMTGLTVYWTGRWNSNVANDDMSVSIFNYTANKWIEFPNKIPGSGTGSKSISNSLSLTNLTKAGLVNGSGTNVRIKFNDTNVADGSSSRMDYDYLTVSCDQLSQPTWQEVKGSSEMHITSPFPYYIEEVSLTINSTVNTQLYNGSSVNETYYTGFFVDKFSVSSGTSVTVSDQVISHDPFNSLPCNAITNLFSINNTGYYPQNFTTHWDTTTGVCDIVFTQTLIPGGTVNYEAHGRNVWESDFRSSNSGVTSIAPLISAGCDLWAISQGETPYPYIIPKNQSNDIGHTAFYMACSNWYDDYYAFNVTYTQSIIDKSKISDLTSFDQYEADYYSLKFAEDKLNTITSLLTQDLISTSSYSQLILVDILNRSNLAGNKFFANQSTVQFNYNALKALSLNATNNTVNYSLINSGVWSYFNRTLTDFNFQINATATVNTTAVADSIWSYNNRSLTLYVDTTNYTLIGVSVWTSSATISVGLLNQIVNAIWGYSGLIANNVVEQFSNSTWTHNVRNLTFYPSATVNTTDISSAVWSYPTRNLTYYQNFGDQTNYTLIQESVWQNLNRTLTEFNFSVSVNETAIANAVWQNVDRTLTGFNFTVNATVEMNNTAISDAVWNAVNRTLTDYNQSDLTDYNKIQQMVWNATERNLTYYQNFGDQTNYTLIQEMVWDATNRSLTEFNFSVSVNETAISYAVWSSVNRSLTDYNQSDLTNYVMIQEMVWNATQRTLTDFNFTVNVNQTQLDNVVNYSLIQQMVWEATNRTLSEFNFTVTVNETAIADAVWASSNRTLSYYPSWADLTNYTLIQEVVWDASVRTLTDFNFTVNATINNTDVAVAVWAYTNKTVQFANGSVDTVNDIQDMGHTYVGGTEYTDGDNGKITIRLVRGTGSLAEVETGANCSVSITYPNNTYFVFNETMSELGDGAYYYNFIVPQTLGIYPYFTNCLVGDRKYFSLDDFHIYANNYSSIPGDVWNNPSRNLTYTAPGLTANDVWTNPTRDLTYYPTTNISLTNESIQELGAAVWNYNGVINSNILTQFANAVSCTIQNIQTDLNLKWGVQLNSC